ncbi:Glycosyltransferase-like protein gnt14 [Auxenochlorella protothecoides]|uniref:Glycosyltransferase-like protein gnt14 n=1 Tax=Auxenochlorella protothecoides TaxID=3075 RepID=A0A087SSJ2_AUXPR|nr:Glycosyltransferase-like protein gnt14 [Auxenochlorella protothecoides]KFM28696.1 Glycosyltransferase-like protein gnt14 [Auxenochlorella protothecoides]
MEAEGSCMLDLTLVVQDFDDVVEADYYTFNAARNQALRLALTEAVLLLDVDFILSASFLEELRSPNAYDSLISHLHQHRLLIIPAFETNTDEEDGEMLAKSLVAEGKDAAVDAFLSNETDVFQRRWFPAGHASDKTLEWIDSSQIFSTEYTENYEPYVVILRKDVVWYDERFRGYKASFNRPVSR